MAHRRGRIGWLVNDKVGPFQHTNRNAEVSLLLEISDDRIESARHFDAQSQCLLVNAHYLSKFT